MKTSTLTLMIAASWLPACGGDAFTAGVALDHDAGEAGVEVDAASEAASSEAARPDDAGAAPEVSAGDAMPDARPQEDAGCLLIGVSNGVGQTYEACDPPGTHTLEHAMLACQAYAATLGEDASHCSHPWTCGPSNSVCHSTSDVHGSSGLTCETYCWVYDGPSAGVVSSCACPYATVGAW